MPLKYLINEPQIEEYRRLLGEHPTDWEPSAEDTATIALLQWQLRFAYFSNSGGQVAISDSTRQG